MKRALIPFLVAALLLGAGLALVSRPAVSADRLLTEPASIRLYPTALVGIAEGNPNLSLGSAAAGKVIIGWSHRPEWGRRRALLRFDLSDLPPGAHIREARLVAEVAGWNGLPTLETTVAPLLSAWQAGHVAWNSQPACSADYVQATLGTAGRVQWRLTDWVVAWQRDPARNDGLLLDSLAAFPENNERTLSQFALELVLAEPSTSLTLNITARRDPVPAGEILEYELRLTNSGPAAARDPTIVVTLPSEVHFIWCSDGGLLAPNDEGRLAVRWNLAELSAGRTYRIFLTLRASPGLSPGRRLVLSAQAAAANSAGATATAGVTIGPPPSPTPTRTATFTVTPTSTRTPATGTPTQTRRPTYTPTPSPTTLPCGSERVVNGDFEYLYDGWRLDGESRPIIVLEPIHDGMFSLLLGSSGIANVPGDSNASQIVRLSADAISASLSFWYYLTSTENDPRYDWFEVLILDPAGRILSTLLKQGRSTHDWTMVRFDLTNFRGQTVQVLFRAHNDGSAGETTAYLDDVSLCVARPPVPEPPPQSQDLCKLPARLPDYAPAGMPDFSARQDEAWKYASDDRWAFDGPAAAANVLWHLDALYETGDFPPPNISDRYPLVRAYGDWDDHAPENVAPLIAHLASLADTNGLTSGHHHAGTALQDLVNGLRAYLAEPGRNLSERWEIQLQVNPSPAQLRGHVAAQHGVILLLGFWQWSADGWGRLGGRYVSLAGVGCQEDFVAVSDPLRDAAELGFAGDIAPMYDHPHPAIPPYPPDDIHNDAAWISHDFYPSAQIDADWGLAGYALDIETIADALGHNFAIDATAPRQPNPHLPIAARIEYAIVIQPKGAAPAPQHDGLNLAASTLRLQIAQEGRPQPPDPAWAIPILVTLRRAGDVAPRAFFSTRTDQYGRAILYPRVEPGNWEIQVRGPHTLILTHPWVVLAPGETNLILNTLVEGDADLDNQITATDLSLLAAAYGSSAGQPAYDARVDFNEDRQINDADLSLWTRNQGRRGEIAAQNAPIHAGLRLERIPAAASPLSLRGVGLTFTPSNTKTIVGRVFQVCVRVESLEQQIDAAEIHLDFDPTRLQIVDADGRPVNTIEPAGALSTVLVNRVDNRLGRIDFIAAQLTPPYPPSFADLASFHVRAVQPTGRTWLRYVTALHRRTTAAYQGEDLARAFYALNVAIKGRSARLPLLYKR